MKRVQKGSDGNLFSMIVCRRCRSPLGRRNRKNNGFCDDCTRTLHRGYEISRKARLGTDEGHYHARMIGYDGYPVYKAVCGTEPDSRAAGWSGWKPAERKVTCKQCLARLSKKRGRQ